MKMNIQYMNKSVNFLVHCPFSSISYSVTLAASCLDLLLERSNYTCFLVRTVPVVSRDGYDVYSPSWSLIDKHGTITVDSWCYGMIGYMAVHIHTELFPHDLELSGALVLKKKA